MTDLKTTFAGLSLRNPIIISSSGLTNSAGKNKKLAEDGAGAIVLKSLFEEQIMLEADQLKDPAFYPEASDYLEEYIREHKLSEYLTLIKESKKVCPIPIIASINCYTDSEWIDFAKMIEEAGADALEINILALQSEVQYTYGSFEQRHIDILRHIKKTIKIPVIMKLLLHRWHTTDRLMPQDLSGLYNSSSSSVDVSDLLYGTSYDSKG